MDLERGKDFSMHKVRSLLKVTGTNCLSVERATYEVSLRYLSGFAQHAFPINIDILVFPDPLLGPINTSDTNRNIFYSHM